MPYLTKYRDRKNFGLTMYALVMTICVVFFIMKQLAAQSVARRQLLRENPRILCSVPFKVRSHAQAKIAVIVDTWGKECDGLKFFIDKGEKKNFEAKYHKYLVEIDMVRKSGDGRGPDGRPTKHIWERVWRSHVWAYENALDDYEWFTKIDCDTYVIMPNVKEYLVNKGLDPDEPHYLGHKLYHQTPPIISGPFTLFSRGAMSRVGPVLKNMRHEYGDRKNFRHGTCVDRDGATEERTMSLCLQSVGVYAEDTSNDMGQIRSLVWTPSAHLAKRRGSHTASWFWANKPPHMKDRADCCAVDAHSLHPYKNPADMSKLHKQLRATGYLGDSMEDNFLKKVRDYLLLDDPDGTDLRSY